MSIAIGSDSLRRRRRSDTVHNTRPSILQSNKRPESVREYYRAGPRRRRYRSAGYLCWRGSPLLPLKRSSECVHCSEAQHASNREIAQRSKEKLRV